MIVIHEWWGLNDHILFAAALASAGESIELHRHDGVHAFANPSNPNYDQAAAADVAEHLR